MRLLFDQNLSPELPSLLQELFPGSLHVIDLDLDAADDNAIWECAKLHGCIVATKDKDFEDLSEFMGHPPKIIRITLGNVPTSIVESLLRGSYLQIETFENDPGRGLLKLP